MNTPHPRKRLPSADERPVQGEKESTVYRNAGIFAI